MNAPARPTHRTLPLPRPVEAPGAFKLLPLAATTMHPDDAEAVEAGCVEVDLYIEPDADDLAPLD